MSDPYLDPTSGILRNKFGLREQKALDAKEADVVFVRSNLLQSNPIEGNYDCEHLKGIHRYLFQDVYDWAGQFRRVAHSIAFFAIEWGRQAACNIPFSRFARSQTPSYLSNPPAQVPGAPDSGPFFGR
jgi:fido (protein-threonine AMPylation protein)